MEPEDFLGLLLIFALLFGAFLLLEVHNEQKAYCHKVVKTIQVDEHGNETTVTRKTSTC